MAQEAAVTYARAWLKGQRAQSPAQLANLQHAGRPPLPAEAKGVNIGRISQRYANLLDALAQRWGVSRRAALERCIAEVAHQD